MSCLAGVVYPDLLQVSDLADSMLHMMRRSLDEHCESFAFKNFQIGCCNTKIHINEKKNLYLILDGRIDNSAEIAAQLKQKEMPFNGSPEEILLKAYETFGIEFLDRINGEFAFSLLDQEKNCLILVRDRIGKKPLYWYHDKHYFIYASELKALLSTGIVPQTAAPDALASYLFFGFTPQDMTPIKDINKLLPGHYLRFSLGQGKSILPYWSYSSYFEEPYKLHKSQVSSKINELMENAVLERLPKGNAPGCFISGGLGSATVAYYISSLAKEKSIKAFSVAFQGQNEEDVLAAKEVAQDLNIELFCKGIDSKSFLDDLIKIIWYLDEPLADPNILATWKLCQLSSKSVKTVFSGMGSDELLAGHSRYSLAERDLGSINRLMLIPKPIIQKILVPLINFFYPPAACNILKVSRTNLWQFEYLRDNALFDEKKLSVAAPQLAGLFDPDTFLHKFHNLSRIKSIVSSFLYFDVKTRLPDCFILQYERLTRAHRLDWETPFLNRHLVEFAAHLPEPETLQENETASYLKPLIQAVFPAKFLNRPKKTRKGFLSSWMADPELYEIMKLLLKGTLVETGFISEKWLKNCLATNETAQEHFRYLFAILVLEIWFRLFINRPMQAHPPQISVRELLLEG